YTINTGRAFFNHQWGKLLVEPESTQPTTVLLFFANTYCYRINMSLYEMPIEAVAYFKASFQVYQVARFADTQVGLLERFFHRGYFVLIAHYFYYGKANTIMGY